MHALQPLSSSAHRLETPLPAMTDDHA
ncbi:hypothetical protein RS9916_33047 [Synechococcus sp. RS9916]|nr:hypothetical protein RS9916_33047 [Synechococcus sp. RS9916]